MEAYIGVSFWNIVKINSIGCFFKIIPQKQLVKLGVKLDGELNLFGLAQFVCEGKAEVTFSMKGGTPKIKLGVAVRSQNKNGFNPFEVIGTKVGIPAKYIPNIWTMREIQCAMVIGGSSPEIQIGMSGSIFGVPVTALIAFTGPVPVAFFFQVKDLTLKRILKELLRLPESVLTFIPNIGIKDLLIAMSTRNNFEVDFKEPEEMDEFKHMNVDNKKPDSWNGDHWEASSSESYELSYGFEMKGVINLFDLIKMGAQFKISRTGLYFRWELDITKLKTFLDDIAKKASSWLNESNRKARRAFDNASDKFNTEIQRIKDNIPWPFTFVVGCVLELVRQLGNAAIAIAKMVTQVVLNVCNAAVTMLNKLVQTFLILDKVSFELDVGDGRIRKLLFSIILNMFGKKIPMKVEFGNGKSFTPANIANKTSKDANSKWEQYKNGISNQTHSTCSAVEAKCIEYLKQEANWKKKHGKKSKFKDPTSKVWNWMNENRDKNILDPNFTVDNCPSFNSLKHSANTSDIDLSSKPRVNGQSNGKKQPNSKPDNGDQGEQKGNEPNVGNPNQNPQKGKKQNNGDNIGNGDGGDNGDNGEDENTDDDDDSEIDDDSSILSEIDREMENEENDCTYTELPMAPVDFPENLHRTEIHDVESSEKYKRITNRIMDHFKPIDTKNIITRQEVEDLVDKYKDDEERVIKILEEKLKEEIEHKQNKDVQQTKVAPKSDELKKQKQDASQLKLELDEMKQHLMSQLLAEDKAIIEDEKIDEIKEIIGDIEDGQSLFVLTFDLEFGEKSGKIVFDGKDEDFENKYKFLANLKEAMDKNGKISIEKVLSLIEEDENLYTENPNADNLYCNYLKHELNGISCQISDILHKNNKDVMKKIKEGQISLLSFGCMKFIQYFAKPNHKQMTLQSIIDELFTTDNNELQKLNFYQKILSAMNDNQTISIDNIVNILKEFGGNHKILSSQDSADTIYCIHKTLLCSTNIVTICDSAFDEKNNVIRKEITTLKLIMDIDIKPIISYLSHEDNLKLNLPAMINNLLSNVNEYDVDKLLLFQEIFKELQHGEQIKATVMCRILNKCQLKISYNDWTLEDCNNEFFFIYTNLCCDKTKTLLKILEELRKNKNGNISINVRLLLQQLLKNNDPINIIPLYNKALTFKDKVDIDNKYKFYDKITILFF
eukprot:271143_1